MLDLDKNAFDFVFLAFTRGEHVGGEQQGVAIATCQGQPESGALFPGRFGICGRGLRLSNGCSESDAKGNERRVQEMRSM